MILKSLGKKDTEYKDQYDPFLLEKIERLPRRKAFTAPMFGVDVWTAYEFSFLLTSGMPYYTVLRITNPSDSKFIFESKSLKLYLNSFNNTVLKSVELAIQQIQVDLSRLTESTINVREVREFQNVRGSSNYFEQDFQRLENITDQTITDLDPIKHYEYNDMYLFFRKSDEREEQKFYSDLLRSNCEITNQPDWGRIWIQYIPNGKVITPENLLRYLVSYRKHQEFHEPTCERIYNNLYNLLIPKELIVTCQYTRRGGIDINPIRFNKENRIQNDHILFDLPKLNQQ